MTKCSVVFFFETGFLYLVQAGLELLCSPGWTQTPKDPPAIVSQVLGLQACATTQGIIKCFEQFYPQFFSGTSNILELNSCQLTPKENVIFL